MEDVLVYIFWIVVIGGSIANSIAKARKKVREADSRTSTAGRNATPTGTYPGSGAGSTGSGSRQGGKPARKSLAEILEELAEQGQQRRETPSPTAWPVFGPVAKSAAPVSSVEPTATSHDYYSLETEFDATDGRGYRESYNADDISAYESLASERANRTTYSGMAAQTTGARIVIDKVPSETPTEENDALNGNADNGDTLEEILGGEFDLRRAVIEAEILTPKYGGVATKYF